MKTRFFHYKHIIQFRLYFLPKIVWAMCVLISFEVFSQPDKPYLPTRTELSFPSQVAQNCFGTKRAYGSIVQIEQPWEFVKFNQSFLKGSLMIAGRQFDHGLGVHANSKLLIRLPRPARRFRALVGYDENKLTREHATSRIIFSIEANGRTLWQSKPLGLEDQAVTVDIAMGGVTEFYLKVNSADINFSYCHANWVGAKVDYDNNQSDRIDSFSLTASAISELPLSFVLGGRSSRQMLGNWKRSVVSEPKNDRILHKIRWTKPDKSFEVRCELTEFTGHPALEWKLFFKNTSGINSPVLENVLPLDLSFSQQKDLAIKKQSYNPPKIHGNKGSNYSAYDFMPFTEILEKEVSDGKYPYIINRSSLSSESFLPFWNLEYSGAGLVTALGWSGSWKSSFSYTADDQVKMSAGMANMKLYLKPGEEISSPSVCTLFWTGGDANRGNNLFRRYMKEKVVPKWDGKEPVTFSMSGGSSALETVTEINQLDYIRKIAGTGANVYWLDAGWYNGPPGEKWSAGRGNWFPDPRKFPNGMKVLADEAHRNNLKFLLWFEPESVAQGSAIAVKYPGWVLRQPDHVNRGLYHLGDPEALKYLTDLISGNLIDWDVDIFRNDFNSDPERFWSMADQPGRTGMSEIRYVEGLYKFWDELLRRKPNLLIDNCASGGRRIDYETSKRSVPLWRSDYECELFPDVFEASQNQTYGLGQYLPFQATGQGMTFDKYKDRSLATSSVVLSIGAKPDGLAEVPFEKVKKVWDDLKSYSYLMTGDFYPLTDFALGDKSWMVSQYDSPETDEGCVICFRRGNAPGPEYTFKLQAIDPKANYKLTDIDTREEKIITGAELKGLSVNLNRNESKVLKYTKIKN
jgi:alpha-galactosidase